MSSKFFILALFLVSLFNTNLRAKFTDEMPRETAILQLPDHSESNWKEITRNVSTTEGIVEFIPLNQTIQHSSEVIALQYKSSAHWDTAACILENILERVRKATLSTYPKGTVTWQIIEKDNEGITYEWILHKPYKSASVQHEISRAFLSPSGFHRVSFTQKRGPMNLEERAKWIHVLKQHASVVSLQDAKRMEGLSMVEKLQDAVSLEAQFHDWRMIDHCSFKTGYSLVRFIPPVQIDTHVIEYLEVVTMPNVKLAPVGSFFEMEKKRVHEQVSKKVKFHVLEQSPTEIIYFYSHPKDTVQLNAVVRTFLTDYGYYSICYKKGLEGQVQKEEMTAWIEKLKTIQVKSPAKATKVAFSEESSVL